jgi:hypothetical protein
LVERVLFEFGYYGGRDIYDQGAAEMAEIIAFYVNNEAGARPPEDIGESRFQWWYAKQLFVPNELVPYQRERVAATDCIAVSRIKKVAASDRDGASARQELKDESTRYTARFRELIGTYAEGASLRLVPEGRGTCDGPEARLSLASFSSSGAFLDVDLVAGGKVVVAHGMRGTLISLEGWEDPLWDELAREAAQDFVAYVRAAVEP